MTEPTRKVPVAHFVLLEIILSENETNLSNLKAKNELVERIVQLIVFIFPEIFLLFLYIFIYTHLLVVMVFSEQTPLERPPLTYTYVSFNPNTSSFFIHSSCPRVLRNPPSIIWRLRNPLTQFQFMALEESSHLLPGFGT